jgi:hypothetical protein
MKEVPTLKAGFRWEKITQARPARDFADISKGRGLPRRDDGSGSPNWSSFYDMATTVLRVRLIGGDRIDITYDEPDVSDEDQLVEHVISTLAQDSGVLRCKHGDRLIVLYGRGVAAVEVAPRGAVL